MHPHSPRNAGNHFAGEELPGVESIDPPERRLRLRVAQSRRERLRHRGRDVSGGNTRSQGDHGGILAGHPTTATTVGLAFGFQGHGSGAPASKVSAACPEPASGSSISRSATTRSHYEPGAERPFHDLDQGTLARNTFSALAPHEACSTSWAVKGSERRRSFRPQRAARHASFCGLWRRLSSGRSASSVCMRALAWVASRGRATSRRSRSSLAMRHQPSSPCSGSCRRE